MGNIKKIKQLLTVSGLLLLGLQSNAASLVLDGKQSVYQVQLNSEVSHTEYRTETRATTCTREVFDGYQEHCRRVGGGRTCERVGGGQSCGVTPTGRECHDVPGHLECTDEPGYQECSSEPRYRTEYFSCTESVQIPFQVKDYDVVNDVTVSLDGSAEQLLKLSNLSEVVDLVAVEKDVKLVSVKSSGKVLLLAKKQTQVVSSSGSLTQLQTTIFLQAIDRNAAVMPFQTPLEIYVQDKAIMVSSGVVSAPELVEYRLNLRRDHFFKKDEDVLNRALSKDEITFIRNGQQTLAKIDLSKLGVLGRVDGKRVKINVQLTSKLDISSVINKQDIPGSLGMGKDLKTQID